MTDSLSDHSSGPLRWAVPHPKGGTLTVCVAAAYDEAVENVNHQAAQRKLAEDEVDRLQAENEALRATARVLVHPGTELARAIAAATHGDPPDRTCLPGSDEKWQGYLLGVEEATAAAAGWVAAQRSVETDEQEVTDA